MVKALCKALVDAAQPKSGSVLLEVGTGSGRCSLPLSEAFLSHGARMIGMDLLYTKLSQLASDSRAGGLNLVQGDALSMPFPEQCFDAIITVHVMHLVAQQDAALEEFRRLLRPGGVYLRGVTEQPTSDSVWARLRQTWQSLLENKGLEQSHSERDARAISGLLRKMGAKGSQVQVSERRVTTSPRREMTRIAAKAKKGAWQILPELLPELLAELERLSVTEYASPEQPMQYTESVVVEVWRFPEAVYG